MDKYEQMVDGATSYDLRLTQVSQSGRRHGIRATISDEQLRNPGEASAMIQVMEQKLLQDAGYIAENRKWELVLMNKYIYHEQTIEDVYGESQ